MKKIITSLCLAFICFMQLHGQTSTYVKTYKTLEPFPNSTSYVSKTKQNKKYLSTGGGFRLIAEINEFGDTIKTSKIIPYNGGIGSVILDDVENNLWLNGARVGITPYTQIFLSKLDSNYKPLFSKVYSCPTGHLNLSAISFSDTTFLVKGVVSQGAWNNPVNMALIKADKNGDTLWSKRYDDGGTALSILSANPFTSGSFICAGQTNAIDTGDIVISKIDRNGNVVWAKSYGGALQDGGGLQFISNNSFYFLCGSNSFGGNSLILKTDTLGNLLSAKSVSCPIVYSVNGQYESDKGVFTLTGMSNFNTPNWDFLAMQIDTNGIVVNNESYAFSPDNDYGLSFSQMNDKGYLFTLSEYNNSISNYDTKIFKTDSLFNSGCLPNTTLSFTTTDVTALMHVNTLTMVASPLYIDVIDTVTFGSGRGCAILPECNGFVEVDESKANENEFFIYPNPANNFIDIETEFKNYSISVFDNMGKLILKEETNQNETRIDISSFSNGIYFIQLQSNGKLLSKKFIKE